MINLDGVSKEYLSDGQYFYALKDINLIFPDSGLFIIKGKSGAGKTTLLNILAKIDYPSGGKIESNFKYDIAPIVYQDAQLIDEMSVYDNLIIVAQMHGKGEEDIDKLLKTFDIYELKNKDVSSISGGERQRLSIIRALLVDSPMLLCDEPTANLDKTNSLIVIKKLKELSNEKLVIVSSHDYELYEEYLDGCVELDYGTIITNSIICNDKDKNSIYENDSIVRELPLRTMFKLSFKGIKKTYARYIVLCLSLLVSLTIVLFAFNLLFLNASDVKYRYNNKLEYINYKNTYQSNVETMYEDDYENLSLEYCKVLYLPIAIELYSQYQIGDLVYDLTESPYDILAGTGSINGNEIIISSEYADIIIEKTSLEKYSDLLGMNTSIFRKEAVISGVYDSTGINVGYLPILADLDYFKEMPIKEAMSAWYFTYYNDETKKINSIEFIDIEKNKCNPAIGHSVELDNEIIIPYDEAIKLVKYDESKLHDLVGRKWESFNYSFVKATYSQKHNASSNTYELSDFKSISEKYEFTIAGITDTGFQISANLYNELLEKYDTSSYLYGFAIEGGISHSKYNLMHKLGYIDDTQYTEIIDNAYNFIDKISIITVIVGVVLSFISFSIVFNYISFSQVKKIKEIGILSSFGMKKKSMLAYLLLDIFVAVTITIVASTMLLLLVNHFFNYYLVNNDFINVEVIYFSRCIMLISFIVLLLFYLVSITFTYLKNKNKSIRNLVYGK